MSMQFNGSVHADGWWDHMPAGHTRNVVMNNGAVDRETNVPREQLRNRQGTYTAAWVLLFVGAAGGLSMAAAHQLDPAGFDAKVDAVVASAHDLGDKISEQFDNKKPAVNMDVTALNNNSAPQTTTTPAATDGAAPAAQATTTDPAAPAQPAPQATPQPAPQAGATPAPQQLLQQQPTGAGASKPEAKPAPQQVQPVAVSKSTLEPPAPVAPLPVQTQPETQLQPVAPITPVTPVNPATSVPPIPPATQAPPATQTTTQTPPPQQQPPAQGPQSEQNSL